MGDKLICITKNRKAMKIIILHDADARIEYLDVADHLIGSDIEEFLTRQWKTGNPLRAHKVGGEM